MKHGGIGGVLLFLGLSAVGVSAAQRPETLDEMKTRAAQVPVEEKVRVCASVARRAVDEAKDRFARGIDDEGRLLLRDVEAYGDLAVAADQNKAYGLVVPALDARAKFLPELPFGYFLRATAYDHLRDRKNAAIQYHKFLDAADGKFPDQEWQARHRLIAIEPKK